MCEPDEIIELISAASAGSAVRTISRKVESEKPCVSRTDRPSALAARS
jgi:hypothetical protein